MEAPNLWREPIRLESSRDSSLTRHLVHWFLPVTYSAWNRKLPTRINNTSSSTTVCTVKNELAAAKVEVEVEVEVEVVVVVVVVVVVSSSK